MSRQPPRNISRRRFLGQASCAAVGCTSLFSTLLNLRMSGTAAAQTLPPGNDYKALVCLFLAGGNDSFNMLVPRGASEYVEYAAVRGDIALAQADLLPINPLTYTAKSLGLHPSMSELQALFEAGDAAFITNVGTLVEPVTKAQYESGAVPLPKGLYSHSDQIQQWQTSVPQSTTGIGWGGRTADLLHMLNDNENISMNISLSGSNVWQAGNEVFEYAISNNGSIGLSGYGHSPGFWGVQGAAIDSRLDLDYQNLFEKTFARTSRQSIDAHEEFSAAIGAESPFTTVFPGTQVASDLHMVARTIAARQTLNMRRQTFFVMFGGWDHHDEVLNNQLVMLQYVSQAVNAFFSALGEIGMQQDVTLFTASDFGRTLTSNQMGSDHAWGGNHFVVGGGVNGRDIYRDYPDLYADNPLDTGRGRLIPSISCDEYFAELALWLGVDKGNLSVVLPNIGHFYDTGSSAPPLGFMQGI